MRRFYAAPAQFKQQVVYLNLDESKHLRDVLRLREADEVSVFDGAGREFSCTVDKPGRGKELAELKLIGEIKPPAPESKLRLTLAIALLKGEKFDLVIQKAAELGVSKVVPLKTKRADVKIKDEKEAAKKLDRWRRVALEAAKQCGRAVIPEISPPIEFSSFVQDVNGTRVLFAERDGASLAVFVSAHPEIVEIVAIIGPEGGWEDEEIALARRNGVDIITLGGRILRAETAGITISALLQHLYGDFN